MKFNLDNYIKKLLQEAKEERKILNADPAAVNFCFERWNKELENATDDNGMPLKQLTREQVEGAIKNFNTFILQDKQLDLGFMNPQIYTFVFRQMYVPKENKLIQNGNINRQKQNRPLEQLKNYVFGDLPLDPDIINVRFNNIEKVLLNDRAVLNSLNNSIANNEPKFFIAKDAKRDETGNVILRVNDSGKRVPAEMIDVYERTPVGIKYLKSAKEKIEKLQPYIDKLKNIKNYSIDDIKFLLDQYNKNTLQEQAQEIDTIEREMSSGLEWSIKKGNIVNKELKKGRNLVYTSPDGKTRVYGIYDHRDSLRVGYYLRSVKERISELLNKGVVTNKSGMYLGQQWCVTDPNRLSYYGDYRRDSGYRKYTFYLLVSDHYDFYNMTDEEIIAKGDEWRDFSNLTYYLDMIDVPLRPTPGEVAITPINNPGENTVTYEFLSKKFPTFQFDPEIIKPRSYDESEALPNVKALGNDSIDSPLFWAAQSEAVKLTYIKDQHGSISNVNLWRSLSDNLKKAYFDNVRTNAYGVVDTGNLKEKFKSISVYKDIVNDKKIFNYGYNVLVNIKKGNKGFDQSYPGMDAMDFIRTYLLKEEYQEDPYRVSEKNKNVVLYQKRNSPIFHLYNITKMEPYEKDGIVYDGDYKRDAFLVITKTDNPKDKLTAEKFSKIKDQTEADTFWVIYKLGSSNSYFLSDEKINELLNNGTLKRVDNNKSIMSVDDPSDILKQQDIDEMKKRQ